jgi:hypothetical protein
MHKSSLIPNDDGVFPLESDMQGNLPVSFGKGATGAPASSYGVAQESSIWKVMLGLCGMCLETAFPGV